MTRDRWWGWGTGHRSLVTGHALVVLLTACNVTPLTNKIRVGEEPFVIGVGEGPDSMTDLFAAPAGGGGFVRLTFNRAEERAPRLSPNGTSVAFLRRSEPGSPIWSLVVLDLLSNGEQSALIPQAAGNPEAVGWSRDGRRLVVRAAGFLATPAPPDGLWLAAVPLDSVARADSLTQELLGQPPGGKVGECGGASACIAAATGEVTRLGEGTRGAIRWGTDSVGYFTPGGFEVRPLLGGRVRRPGWSGVPSGLRQLTYHPGGQVTTSSGTSGRR